MGRRGGRTNPGYLSKEEVARDRARTAVLVRSIVSSKQVNHEVSSRKETRRGWYTDRLCDSCGDTLQMSSWRCQKCDISLCLKCAREIKLIQKKKSLCCPMCGERLE